MSTEFGYSKWRDDCVCGARAESVEIAISAAALVGVFMMDKAKALPLPHDPGTKCGRRRYA